jgi:hypothetical protein
VRLFCKPFCAQNIRVILAIKTRFFYEPFNNLFVTRGNFHMVLSMTTGMRDICLIEFAVWCCHFLTSFLYFLRHHMYLYSIQRARYRKVTSNAASTVSTSRVPFIARTIIKIKIEMYVHTSAHAFFYPDVLYIFCIEHPGIHIKT